MVGEPGDKVLESRREEALALLHANQAARSAADRTLTAVLAITGAALAAGVDAGTDAVVIPVPAVVLLLLSHMFQQYADLTAIGMARKHLEAMIEAELGEPALIYESIVADIRKDSQASRRNQRQPLLAWSVLALQVLVGLAVLALTGVALKAALDESGLVLPAFAVGTTLAAASAGYSFVDMLRTNGVATAQIKGEWNRRIRTPEAD